MTIQQTKSQNRASQVESLEFLNPPPTQPKSSPTHSKLLIVDSSDSNRCALRTAVGELEHELIEAETTSDAISAISLHQVDLVLIDSFAPELGGAEFCRMLKKAGATQFLPVFVMATSDDVDNEVRAIDAGADEFLTYPLRPRSIRARIQASLRHKAMIDSLDHSETVLFSLAQSVEERDPGLGQHCQRLALMAAAMGVAIGLGPHDVLALQRGGYLHDVGKVAIPDHILFKAGKLNPEEWEIMKSHAERGERICSSMRSLAPVLPIIRHHHERWDGSGYPDCLKGEEIPLLARILQLADIYDALTTARPYKPAFTSDEAIQILNSEAERGWRDPTLVATFSDILPMFRTHAPPDISRMSLHALAASIERYRKGPARSSSIESSNSSESVKSVVGL
jgi:putative two-component system response regulator